MSGDCAPSLTTMRYSYALTLHGYQRAPASALTGACGASTFSQHGPLWRSNWQQQEPERQHRDGELTAAPESPIVIDGARRHGNVQC